LGVRRLAAAFLSCSVSSPPFHHTWAASPPNSQFRDNFRPPPHGTPLTHSSGLDTLTRAASPPATSATIAMLVAGTIAYIDALSQTSRPSALSHLLSHLLSFTPAALSVQSARHSPFLLLRRQRANRKNKLRRFTFSISDRRPLRLHLLMVSARARAWNSFCLLHAPLRSDWSPSRPLILCIRPCRNLSPRAQRPESD